MISQSQAGLLRREVHVGHYGDDSDYLLRADDGGLALHLADALLDAAGGQASLGVVVPAVVNGFAEHGQTLREQQVEASELHS